MNYAALFTARHKGRHLRAHDPHNAIGVLAPFERAPEDLWSKIDVLIDGTAQPQTTRNGYALSGVLGGVAVAAALLLFGQFEARDAGLRTHAHLTHDGSAYRLTAAQQIDQAPEAILTLTSGVAPAPDGKSLEVWYVPADGSAPGSLGVLAGDNATSAHIVPAPDWENGVLAISVEASGGSLSGAPEGPIVATTPLDVLF